MGNQSSCQCAREGILDPYQCTVSCKRACGAVDGFEGAEGLRARVDSSCQDQLIDLTRLRLSCVIEFSRKAPVGPWSISLLSGGLRCPGDLSCDPAGCSCHLVLLGLRPAC
eukprot:321096-Amphidinium_carterae.1